jgi:translation initiation factor 1
VKPKHTFRGVVIHEDQARFKTVIRAPVAAKGGPARVRVAREVSGRGGKGVSVISGLPLAAPALEELAARLKKLCGAGGAVKEGAIEIQGDHRDRLVAELHKLGYDAKRSGG